MRIIGSTSFMKNDLDQGLETLKSLGFSEVDLIGVESWGMVSPQALVDDFEEEAARIEGLLKKHGLHAVSLNFAVKPDLNDRSDAAANQSRLEMTVAVCKLMTRLGVKVAAHYPGHIADWKNDPEGVWRDTTATLREMQEASVRDGVALAPEIHFNTPFEHPDDARRLLREIPGIPYTYEPSHFIVRGHDYRQTGDLLAGACHVHLRGCAEGKLQAPPDTNPEAMEWVIRQLMARDYQGYVSLEYLPGSDFDNVESIRTLKAMVEGWMQA